MNWEHLVDWYQHACSLRKPNQRYRLRSMSSVRSSLVPLSMAPPVLIPASSTVVASHQRRCKVPTADRPKVATMILSFSRQACSREPKQVISDHLKFSKSYSRSSSKKRSSIPPGHQSHPFADILSSNLSLPPTCSSNMLRSSDASDDDDVATPCTHDQ